MIVPQPRDEGRRRRESGREVLKLPTGVGRWSQGVPYHLGEERGVLVLLGAPREEGLALAALKS